MVNIPLLGTELRRLEGCRMGRECEQEARFWKVSFARD